MRSAVVAITLALSLTGCGYVRRGLPGRRQDGVVVVGSRDRHLAGKARVRARRAA